jgi:hypothetical protein
VVPVQLVHFVVVVVVVAVVVEIPARLVRLVVEDQYLPVVVVAADQPFKTLELVLVALLVY